MPTVRRLGATRVRATLTVATIVLVAIVVAPSAAWAQEFHGYSVAVELSAGRDYSAVGSIRGEGAVANLPLDGCIYHFTGHPVYDTEWILITADALNWVELGTGHQCGDTFRYWFWGRGVNGNWYPYGTNYAPDVGTTHTFTISRIGLIWYWYIDGAIRHTMQWTATGVEVHAGLESYASNATMTYVTVHDLGYKHDGGPWLDWAGYDATIMAGSQMCGRWISQTAWRHSENQPC